MVRFLLSSGAFLGAFAVVLGAFGAHGLKARLDAYSLEIFQKGVEYQYVHVLALLAAGLLALKYPGSLLTYAGIAFMLGILFFSGSLYLLATRQLLGIEAMSGILGPITPIGGLFFIFGWVLLGIHVLKNVNG